MARVLLENVWKTYDGGVDAVRDFNLDIADGEFIVLVGPSGCGKSTTLRMVAGLEEISRGTITIGDRVVNTVHPKDRDIAMVFQNYALYPHMSVYKNMAFALQLRKLPKKEIDRRVREAARMLDIEAYLNRKPRALSGGQRQRVAVGRAIVREPAAFLFDEPLSNLDAKLRVTTRAELKALHQRLKTTTIYVTHDQEEAMTLGDRVVVMAMGEVQQAGSPLEIYRSPVNRFVAGFVGMPPMNFIDGRIELRDGEPWWVQTDGGPDAVTLRVADEHRERLAPAAGDEVILGLRPQAISEAELGEANRGDARAAAECEGRAFVATVGVVELLGEEMDLRLTVAGGQHIVARVRSHAAAEPDERRTFAIDAAAVQYFEPGEFGRNLLTASMATA